MRRNNFDERMWRSTRHGTNDYDAAQINGKRAIKKTASKKGMNLVKSAR